MVEQDAHLVLQTLCKVLLRVKMKGCIYFDLIPYVTHLFRFFSSSCVLWSTRTVSFVSIYILVLMGLIATFFLMQMAMKGGGGDDFQNRNKLLSLELLQVLDNHLHITKFLFQFLAFCLP